MTGIHGSSTIFQQKHYHSKLINNNYSVGTQFLITHSSLANYTWHNWHDSVRHLRMFSLSLASCLNTHNPYKWSNLFQSDPATSALISFPPNPHAFYCKSIIYPFCAELSCISESSLSLMTMVSPSALLTWPFAMPL